MIFDETYTLNNGLKIPKIGYGTWLIDNGKAADAVTTAIKVGYRHIDTAEAYGNEQGVGLGIKQSGISRDEIFLTTKLEAEFKEYKRAVKAIDESLMKLDSDYIDLMIIHAPQPWSNYRDGKHYFEGNLEAWRALEDAHKAGKIKALGVSNFEQVDVENILNNGAVTPVINQFLAHVGNINFDLIKFDKDQGILNEAHSPMGHGEILQNEQLRKIAMNYDATTAQLAIRYLIELGLLPLPKASSIAHMEANAQLDFNISVADMDYLNSLSLDNYGKSSNWPVYAK